MTVRVYPDCSGYFVPGRRMSTGDRELAVVRVRPHKHTTLVTFADVDTRDAAEELRGSELRIPSSEGRSLDENEFLIEDLIGLVVVAGEEELGRVVDVVVGAAQDRLIVERPGGRRTEVPFVDALVPDVIVDEGIVRVVPIEGLFDE